MIITNLWRFTVRIWRLIVDIWIPHAWLIDHKKTICDLEMKRTGKTHMVYANRYYQNINAQKVKNLSNMPNLLSNCCWEVARIDGSIEIRQRQWAICDPFTNRNK